MGTQGAMGYRGIGHMGNETHRGKEVQGVWGTWPIRPTGYGVQGVWGMGYMGNRSQWVQGYRVQGVWGTGGMGYRGYGIQGVWATWVMGHMGNGAHGQWGPWGPWGPWVIGTFLSITSLLLDGFLQKFLLDIDIDVFYLNTG